MRWFLAVVLVLLFSVGYAEPEPKDVEARIEAVTVYTSSATVLRAADIKVTKGKQVLVFSKLPSMLVDDSVRAFATGAPKVKIMGVEVKTVYHTEPVEEILKNLSEEYERVSDEIKRVRDEMSSYDAEMEFVRNIAKAAASVAPLEAVKRKVEVEELKSMVDFIRTTIQNATKKRFELEQKKRGLEKKLSVLVSEMNKLRRPRSTVSKSILVTLVSEAAMDVKCSVTYIVPAASWVPAYDVRYLPETNQVELVYYGVVSQQTGEEWKGVRLELSTAAPTTSVAMPDFMPSVVYPYGTRVVSELSEMRDRLHRAAKVPMAPKLAERWETRKMQMNKQKAEEFGALVRGGAVMAAVQSRFTSVTFKRPGKETIPSDGRPHKSVITIERFAAKMEYVTTPALAKFVYLRASLTNTSAYPILAGEMSAYVGAAFIGKAIMKSVAPNEKFQIYFGTDKDLKVERKVVQMKEEGPTMFRSSRKLSKSFRIKLENFKEKEVTVTVIDSIPVSWTEFVKVTMVECKPDPKEKDEKGKLVWKVKLGARQKVEINFKYDIEHPQGYRLNLEQWSPKRLEKQMQQLRK